MFFPQEQKIICGNLVLDRLEISIGNLLSTTGMGDKIHDNRRALKRKREFLCPYFDSASTCALQNCHWVPEEQSEQ